MLNRRQGKSPQPHSRATARVPSTHPHRSALTKNRSSSSSLYGNEHVTSIVRGDDEGANSGSFFCHQFVINGLFFRFAQQRQTNFKERSSSDFALYADLAMACLNDPLDNGESQPDAPRLTLPGCTILLVFTR